MSSRATPPHLKGYKPLYKGRRFWVFQNDPDNPYEGWTGEWNILAYHRPCETVVATGNWEDDEISGEIVWGQGVPFKADSYKDMAAEVGWLEENYQ